MQINFLTPEAALEITEKASYERKIREANILPTIIEVESFIGLAASRGERSYMFRSFKGVTDYKHLGIKNVSRVAEHFDRMGFNTTVNYTVSVHPRVENIVDFQLTISW